MATEIYTRAELDEHMKMAKEEGFAAALRYAARVCDDYEGGGMDSGQYYQLGDASETKSDIRDELLNAVPSVAELVQEDY